MALVAISAGPRLVWLARRGLSAAGRRRGAPRALRLFFFSIFYLFLLFLVLVVERVAHIAGSSERGWREVNEHDHASRQDERSGRGDGVVLTPEQARSRRARNIAIGVTIALLVVLFYAVTRREARRRRRQSDDLT